MYDGLCMKGNLMAAKKEEIIAGFLYYTHTPSTTTVQIQLQPESEGYHVFFFHIHIVLSSFHSSLVLDLLAEASRGSILVQRR